MAKFTETDYELYDSFISYQPMTGATGKIFKLNIRVMPNIILNDIIGVSPFCGPSEEVFRMRKAELNDDN